MMTVDEDLREEVCDFGAGVNFHVVKVNVPPKVADQASHLLLTEGPVTQQQINLYANFVNKIRILISVSHTNDGTYNGGISQRRKRWG